MISKYKIKLFKVIISSVISFLILGIIGVIKTKITGESKIRGALEMLVIGTIAFICSQSIGLFLERFITNF